MKFSEVRNHLSKFKVGIAGAGGLGSNCAVALARSGIGTLVISDFDVVEDANLNRQFYFADQNGSKKTAALEENIKRTGLRTKIISHQVVLNPENIPVIYCDCDIIVEAFDRADMKEMLIHTVQTRMPGTPLIIGSGMGGWGNSDTLRCRRIDDCLYVCGDESTEVTDETPPMAPRVGIVANMQANIVIDILMLKQ
jgi:sulfur carrier protein ThiS adenylyltransferase